MPDIFINTISRFSEITQFNEQKQSYALIR